MNLDDVPQPDSSTARAALEVATAYCSPALVNHRLRSYLWGASYGIRHDIGFDAELLFVSAMLHDIGLVKEFDSHTVPFEEAGGHVAWVFGAGAGWPVERRRRAAEIIVRHMWDEVDADVDPEGHLPGIATGLDISGRAPGRWPPDFRSEVVRRIPRLTLSEEFLNCFEAQARRKPASSAAAAIEAASRTAWQPTFSIRCSPASAKTARATGRTHCHVCYGGDREAPGPGCSAPRSPA